MAFSQLVSHIPCMRDAIRKHSRRGKLRGHDRRKHFGLYHGIFASSSSKYATNYGCVVDAENSDIWRKSHSNCEKEPWWAYCPFHVLVQTNFRRYYFYFLPNQAQTHLDHWKVLTNSGAKFHSNRTMVKNFPINPHCKNCPLSATL